MKRQSFVRRAGLALSGVLGLTSVLVWTVPAQAYNYTGCRWPSLNSHTLTQHPGGTAVRF